PADDQIGWLLHSVGPDRRAGSVQPDGAGAGEPHPRPTDPPSGSGTQAMGTSHDHPVGPRRGALPAVLGDRVPDRDTEGAAGGVASAGVPMPGCGGPSGPGSYRRDRPRAGADYLAAPTVVRFCATAGHDGAPASPVAVGPRTCEEGVVRLAPGCGVRSW